VIRRDRNYTVLH